MAVTAAYRDYVLEQLAALRGVSSRRMFGGVGLYSEGWFFGLIAADVLYFKVDDSNRAQFESRGCEAFRPFADRPQYSMAYFQVPVDVLEDAEQLFAWAQRSIAVAQRSAIRVPERERSAEQAEARRARRASRCGKA